MVVECAPSMTLPCKAEGGTGGGGVRAVGSSRERLEKSPLRRGRGVAIRAGVSVLELAERRARAALSRSSMSSGIWWLPGCGLPAGLDRPDMVVGGLVHEARGAPPQRDGRGARALLVHLV